MDVAVKTEDRFVEIDGLKIRYLEQGSGHPALLLHGSSLGSSADVFRRNLGPLADGGLRAIAFDFPGFGKSGRSSDSSTGFRKALLIKFMDALGLEAAAVVGHSSSGNIAVGVGLDHPDRISHVLILGTGSLLPPLETGVGGRGEAAQQRLEQRMARDEPGLEDTRKLLEANLYHHELITDDELALRHSNSIGDNFTSFVERSDAGKKKNGAAKPATPLWQRLDELTMPLFLIYGREDRGRAIDRIPLLQERYPGLNLHIAEGCKHMVPWDAEDLFHREGIPFITG